MQWIALNDSAPITALQAAKHIAYICPECHQSVRLRSGPHRQAHFYHLSAPIHCRQHKKSEEHLQLQKTLASLIPFEQGRMERAFPEISRIADVTWESRKILFEIQCSPISLAEVEQRCRDYRSVGWEIVWILSDKRFNKRTLSAAEAYLRLQTCYFSQSASQLHKRQFLNHPRHIYDQYEILKGHRRLYKGPPLVINPMRIVPHTQSPLNFSLPPSLQLRWDSWQFCVEGDILSKLKSSSRKPVWIKSKEAHPSIPEQLSWFAIFKKIYAHLLERMLKKF